MLLLIFILAAMASKLVADRGLAVPDTIKLSVTRIYPAIPCDKHRILAVALRTSSELREVQWVNSGNRLDIINDRLYRRVLRVTPLKMCVRRRCEARPVQRPGIR